MTILIKRKTCKYCQEWFKVIKPGQIYCNKKCTQKGRHENYHVIKTQIYFWDKNWIH
jgi:hypothetical protein